MTVPTGGTVNPALIKIPFHGLRIEDGMIDQLDFLNFITQLASVTPNYSESTFTLTLNGASGATVGCIGTIIGNTAILRFGQAGNTSSATTLTMTGLPTNFIPTIASSALLLPITNGGADGMGMAQVGTNGVITLSSGVTRTGGFPVAWSATGINGVIGGPLIYRLTN